MSKDQLLIEELSLSGSVMLPGVTKRTVRNHAKSINAMLKSQNAKWHVEIEDSNVLVRVSDDGLSPKIKKTICRRTHRRTRCQKNALRHAHL